MAEQVEDNVDLVHPKGGLAAFQFADKADADAGPVGQVLLGHLQRFTLQTDKPGYRIFSFIAHSLYPIGDKGFSFS